MSNKFFNELQKTHEDLWGTAVKAAQQMTEMCRDNDEAELEIKPNNLMSTDGELKQWQKDIMLTVGNDPVNHPSHYTDGKIEVIDFIEDKKLGFHLGNAVKYISRAGKKDPKKTIEDLEKAVWYINREIERRKAELPDIPTAKRNGSTIGNTIDPDYIVMCDRKSEPKNLDPDQYGYVFKCGGDNEEITRTTLADSALSDTDDC